MTLRRAIGWALLVVGISLFACGSDDAPASTPCKAGVSVFCRCDNGDDGVKTCERGGQFFEPCGPCDGVEPPDAEPEDTGTTFDAPVVDIDANQCGDGQIDDGEGCDVGIKDAGGGCSAACVPEGNPFGAGDCPGMQVHVWGKKLTFGGTTVGYPLSQSAKAACGGSTGGTSPNRIYAVTAHKSGTLTVSTTATGFDHMLYARTTCATAASEIACANAAASSETLTFPVTLGSVYYVIVDGGALSTSGAFTISFEIP